LDYPVSITSSIAAAFMASTAEVNESMGLGAVGWWDHCDQKKGNHPIIPS
jgi:hypothetical protein